MFNYMYICIMYKFMHAFHMYLYLSMDVCTYVQNLLCFSLPMATSVISAISQPMCTPAVSELYNITVTCTIHPDSTTKLCVVIAMADDGDTKAGKIHKSLCVLIS